VDQEFVAYFDRRFSDLKSELKSELTSELKSELLREIRAEIAASAAETRRHFDVVADRLMDKIQLVGKGVIGVDQTLDRFRGEVADEFRRGRPAASATRGADHRLGAISATISR
jgi:hypothetical protein